MNKSLSISKNKLEEKIEFWTNIAREDILRKNGKNINQWNWINEIFAEFKGKITMLWILDFISTEEKEKLINDMFEIKQEHQFGKKAGE